MGGGRPVDVFVCQFGRFNPPRLFGRKSKKEAKIIVLDKNCLHQLAANFL
jgi:hypothetical protein